MGETGGTGADAGGLSVYALVLHLKVCLVLLGIDKRCFRPGMAHERLQLLQRHTAADTCSCESVPESVRIDMDPGALAHFLYDVLQCMALNRLMRCLQTDKERVCII